MFHIAQIDEESTEFPPVEMALGVDSPMPGLLAVGGALNADTLQSAYQKGIFPWFSPGQPTLWWSPDPRMVLHPEEFRLHRSLRRSLMRFLADPECEIRIDCDFAQVIEHCAVTPRNGQSGGTWIVPSIVRAYCELHQKGLAHSVEAWRGDQIVGGLYCVALGRAVYGESMFALESDASKIALCALVALCRAHDVPQIDCQQATAHLASLGAREVKRARFLDIARQAQNQKSLEWELTPNIWESFLNKKL